MLEHDGLGDLYRVEAKGMQEMNVRMCDMDAEAGVRVAEEGYQERRIYRRDEQAAEFLKHGRKAEVKSKAPKMKRQG
jgi:hypothetical protein